ncbi:MAG TPA: hypothetical protein ENH56_05650 [Roseobacter sp.]|uniref:DUF5658 domain-containing protein n=1 Tax=marine sediment metagenome TaxID=412755 RepID=A0A0F9SS52_9ZZZZ|nr:hypothetical protein [Roseobacter sp.]
MMGQFSTIEIATAAVFLLLQIADVWTTMQTLKTGATEANPAMAWIMARTGKAWPFVKMALALGGAYLLWVEDLLWAIWLLCAIYTIVVISNWTILKDRWSRGL